MSVRERAYSALLMNNVDEKIAAVRSLTGCEKEISHELETNRVVRPGRPPKPVLVSAADVPRRKIGSQSGRVVQFHAFAHIEFNAINLALDAVYRFSGLPDKYYFDWLQVADEEATHFLLLRDYLRKHGTDYGDYSAHNNLWDMSLATDHDVLVRMALVPRVLEARGLDVTPKIISRLESVGDNDAVLILQRIYQDEIGHVAIGNKWFNFLCQQRNLNPVSTFENLLEEYTGGNVVGPFNSKARMKAGFSSEEIDLLECLSQNRLKEH